MTIGAPIPSLLSGRFEPITTEIGYLECDASAAVRAFQSWQQRVHRERGVAIEVDEVSGNLEARISSLLPLTSVERRRQLFLPTRGEWTAYMDCGWRGTDAFAPISYLAGFLRCRGIRAVCTPNTITREAGRTRGRYGATILEVYEPSPRPGMTLNHGRVISAANDGGRWTFDASGPLLAFEETERYSARRLADRFTPELLDRYLSRLGIRMFSEDFYDCGRPAYLVSMNGPCNSDLKEFSLAQVQADF